MRRHGPPLEDSCVCRGGQFNRIAILLAGLALTGAGTAACEDRGEAFNSNKNSDSQNTREPQNAHAPPKAATAEEMAIVAPLTKGSTLGGWDVVRVEGTDRGALRVVCVQKRSVVRLYIALASDDGPAPPAVAGKFAIFYSLKDASAEDGERLATELAAVIKKNKDAPPPPGMTPFQPRPPEPITL